MNLWDYDYRPRTWSDWAAYGASLVAGPAVWWFVLARTNASEAWDVGLYWPATAAAAFVVGVLVGGSRLPYESEQTPVPPVGFLVAAVIVLTHLVSVLFTSDWDGVPMLPVAIVVFGPIETIVFGTAATAGVLLNRVGGRALRFHLSRG